MLENKWQVPMIDVQTGKEFSFAEFFENIIQEINDEVVAGFDVDASEDNPMVRITIAQSDGEDRRIDLINKAEYPRYLDLANVEDNTLRDTLLKIGFTPSMPSLYMVSQADSLDSYHLELTSPATELKSRYMLSVFDSLFSTHGDVNRELSIAFETLDENGDHNEVFTCLIMSSDFLEQMR